MPYCAHCGSSVTQVSFAPCPSCARPTNGAPPAPPRHSSTASIIVGVLVGAFVVLGIIGILAAIAIPNLLTAMQRSRQKRTMADMQTIAAALEAHHREKGVYPTSRDDVASLPELDGWATPYSFVVTETSYFIGSAGADKSFDKALPEYAHAATENFDCDIVYANGTFIQRPQIAGGTR